MVCRVLTGLLILAVLAGCSRTRYRMMADRDAFNLLREKTANCPWEPPSDFSLHPPPSSRLYDPTPLDDPWLPFPAPQLYAYELPELAPREQAPESLPVPPPVEGGHPVPPVISDENGYAAQLRRLPDIESPASRARAVALVLPAVGAAGKPGPNGVVRIPAVSVEADAPSKPDTPGRVALAGYELASTQVQPMPPLAPAPPSVRPSPEENMAAEARSADTSTVGRMGDILVIPIPQDAWQSLPESCLIRMLEFEKLQEEYQRSWNVPPGDDQLAPGKRLNLEDIVDLTMLNSRDYQTQKEILYRVALRLSLERFAYQIKFSPFNNRTSPTFTTNRTGGTMVNTLSIPTTLQIEKALATGGDFLARFANSVILTFNGPQGFAADVGSDLILDFNQTIFQRDVRFESLTQSERDVIYAARDYLRFRKTLFVQLASQYYNLIRTYRQVEIDSQNYFTLVRAFRQSSAEYNAGELPRFQLDQIEQNVLAGRGRVIATCNSLENALDNLKLRMGLPTETHVNIDLSELKRLTTRDELAVTGELIQRVGRRLREEQVKRTPIRAVLLAQSVVLIERMLEAMELQRGVGDPVTGENELRVQVAQLRVESARENAELDRIALTAELRQTPLQPSRVFLRRMDLVDALLDLLERQVEFGELISNNAAEFRMQRAQLGEFRERANNLHAELDRSVETRQVDQLPQLIDQGAQLQMEIDTIVQQLDARLGFPAERPEAGEATRKSLEDAQRLLEFSEQLVTNLGAGLIPVQIEMDDAMLTALNLRLDLMNQRGDLADSWRQIKYAGDDLKAILNIQATHRVSTRRDVNRVFDFTLDESSTQVGATFDAPLNRRAQRNDFRQALIDYQAAIRQLMLLEDNIKFAVRNDLRALSLDKEQYVIDVASAALASERVITVLLELRLGIGQIAPRDFLEAQNAYAASLSNVASRHIGYIVDRTQLFVDLELLTVDERGFWRELYNEDFQPDPFYQVATYGQPVYGRLVPGLWYSHLIRRMEQVPAGMSAVHNQDGDGDDPSGASPAEPLPAPPAAGHGP